MKLNINKKVVFFALLVIVFINSGSESYDYSGSLNKYIVKNFTYKVEMKIEKDDITYEYFRLKNGKYYNRDLPVYLKIERFLITDLNRDGFKDALVILRGNYGGSGHFYEFTALFGGNPIKQTNSIVLGDRIIIKQIKIKNLEKNDDSEILSQIHLKILTHAPTDPMCCPTKEHDVILYIKNREIVEADFKDNSENEFEIDRDSER